jgi:hypothetical protein
VKKVLQTFIRASLLGYPELTIVHTCFPVLCQRSRLGGGAGLNPIQLRNGNTPRGVTANLLTGLGVDEYFNTSANHGLT